MKLENIGEKSDSYMKQKQIPWTQWEAHISMSERSSNGPDMQMDH